MKTDMRTKLLARLNMRAILWSCFCLFLGGLLAGSLYASESSFLDMIKNSDESFDDSTVPLERPVLKESVTVKEQYNGKFFQTLARKPEIERYKCSNCHTEQPAKVPGGFQLTHSDVRVNHGQGARSLVCLDCHSEKERDFLEDKKGKKIDFDHSYQLCGQCHFRQKRDWLGGAHGKRADNWAGERVVFNCASCHDPHSPRFEKRFPATYSVPLD